MKFIIQLNIADASHRVSMVVSSIEQSNRIVGSEGIWQSRTTAQPGKVDYNGYFNRIVGSEGIWQSRTTAQPGKVTVIIFISGFFYRLCRIHPQGCTDGSAISKMRFRKSSFQIDIH